jgi:hypothetical protein
MMTIQASMKKMELMKETNQMFPRTDIREASTV